MGKLKKINYYVGRKKYGIQVKKVFFLSSGLLFRKNSPPLLFTLPKKMKFSIGSIFCNPFRAIWLDENMKATKVVDVKKWKWKIDGFGKYLLEIPFNKLKTKSRR